MVLERRMQVMDSPADKDSVRPDITGLRVAFATTNMKTVDQHFGSAKSVAIYAVNPDNAVMLEVAEFGRLAQDGNEDKLSDKIAVLAGCAAVYSQAIGSSAIQKLMQAGIQPIKITEGANIQALITALQEEMRLGPSKWLAKAIAKQEGPDTSRFEDMEAEGWQE